ncbi:centromere protein V [Trichonephila clavipes]|nr:centromere protein V [Trichonephila clavipes]
MDLFLRGRKLGRSPFETRFTLSGQYYCRTILDRVLGARAAGVHYRLFSVWTLVPVRLDQQLSDHSTVDEIASGAADCRLTYTMANCPQRRRKREREKEEKRARKRQGLVVLGSGEENPRVLLGDADQESEARMSKNALRTGRRQAVEASVGQRTKDNFRPLVAHNIQQLLDGHCSICSKKQIKGFIVSQGNFELLQGKDDLIEYTFNTEEAKHLFCKTCGVQSFYKPRSNPEGIKKLVCCATDSALTMTNITKGVARLKERSKQHGVMIYCIDPGTITEVKEIKFDGQNWEESMKNEKLMHS